MKVLQIIEEVCKSYLIEHVRNIKIPTFRQFEESYTFIIVRMVLLKNWAIYDV